MIVRALDSNGGWTFGNGIQNYIRLQAAIAQCIRTRFLSWLGDCFFATTDGIDWGNLLSTPNSELAINLAANANILNLVGNVKGVPTNLITGIQQLSFTVDRSTRQFSVQYRVSSIYSTQQITGSFTATLPAFAT